MTPTKQQLRDWADTVSAYAALDDECDAMHREAMQVVAYLREQADNLAAAEQRTPTPTSET